MTALRAFVHEFTQRGVLLGLAVFSVFAFLATAIVVPLALARMPADYFVRRVAPGKRRLLTVLLKNVAGVLLVLLGLVMLVLPGQGLLTLLLGLGLVDFPGRRRLVLHVITRPTVLKAINALRRRAKRPPLEIPPS